MIKQGDIVVAFHKNGDIIVGYIMSNEVRINDKHFGPLIDYAIAVVNKPIRGLVFSNDIKKNYSNIVVVDSTESETGKKIIEPYFIKQPNPYVLAAIEKALGQI